MDVSTVVRQNKTITTETTAIYAQIIGEKKITTIYCAKFRKNKKIYLLQCRVLYCVKRKSFKTFTLENQKLTN
jgi:hypothetical protein